jgi:hypothetical protein
MLGTTPGKRCRAVMGNHELAILLGRWVSYQDNESRKLHPLLLENKDRFKVAAMHQGILLTHAGYSQSFDNIMQYGMPPDVKGDLNNLNTELLWQMDSPLWYRPTRNNPPAIGSTMGIQICGHTPLEWIAEHNGPLPNFYCVDPYCSVDFDKSRYRYAVIEHRGEVTIHDSRTS